MSDHQEDCPVCAVQRKKEPAKRCRVCDWVDPCTPAADMTEGQYKGYMVHVGHQAAEDAGIT